jgi:hypothetical protein
VIGKNQIAAGWDQPGETAFGGGGLYAGTIERSRG